MATDTPIDNPTPEAEGESLGRIAQISAWANEHRMLTLGGVAGSLVTVGLGLALVVRMMAPATDPTEAYETALAALEAGAYSEARKLAESLRELGELPPDFSAGIPDYLEGVAVFHQAELAWEADKPDYYLMASRYLETAIAEGIPPEDENEAVYMLGKSLALGGKPTAARPALREALSLTPDKASEIHYLLAETHLFDSPPDFEAALEENKAYLASPDLTSDQQDRGHMQAAEILLHLKRPKEAQAALNRVRATDLDLAKRTLIRGQFYMCQADALAQRAVAMEEQLAHERLLQRDTPLTQPSPTDSSAPSSEPPAGESDQAASEDASETPAPAEAEPTASTGALTAETPDDEATAPVQEDDLDPEPFPVKDEEVSLERANLLRERAIDYYDRAIESFDEAARLDQHQTPLSQTALFLSGRCLVRVGDYEQARRKLSTLRDLFPRSSAAVGSAFLIADILRSEKKDKEAIGQYRNAVGAYLRCEPYVNPWLTAEEMRDQIDEAYISYLRTDDYGLALSLVGATRGLFTPAQVARRRADTNKAWAEYCLERRAAETPADAVALEKEAVKHYEAAGEAYRELAKQNYLTAEYTENLWQAAEAFRNAENHEATVAMLHWYLYYDKRNRQPRALLYMGEALAHLGRYQAAITILNECTEFHPKDPGAYQARLVASHCYEELGDFDKAEALVTANLSGLLSPRSAEFRDSLLSLGRIQRRNKKYEEAIQTLEKFVDFAESYATSSRHLPEAHYLLGQCHLDLIQQTRERFGDTSAPSVESHRAQEEQKQRGLAVEQFKAAKDTLTEKQELLGELPPHEAAMLRNCYFAIGNTYMDLGKYQEAINVYDDAVLHYQNRAEALALRCELARAYQALGDFEKARESIRAAKTLYATLKESDDFTGTPDFSAADWEKILEWHGML